MYISSRITKDEKQKIVDKIILIAGFVDRIEEMKKAISEHVKTKIIISVGQFFGVDEELAKKIIPFLAENNVRLFVKDYPNDSERWISLDIKSPIFLDEFQNRYYVYLSHDEFTLNLTELINKEIDSRASAIKKTESILSGITTAKALFEHLPELKKTVFVRGIEKNSLVSVNDVEFVNSLIREQ
jgi:hypothetical protein